MRRMRMYRAIYKKELRMIAGPAAVVIGLTLVWFMLNTFTHGALKYYVHMGQSTAIRRIIRLLEHSRLWMEYRPVQQFVPMAVYHIMAVLLGYSLLYEQGSHSRIQMKLLPVGRSVAPGMKFLAVMCMGLVPALLITSSSFPIPFDIYREIVTSLLYAMRAEPDMSLAGYVITYVALLVAHAGDITWGYIRNGFSVWSIMLYYCGLVMVAYGVDDLLRRYRVLTWTVMILAANWIYIIVVTHLAETPSGPFAQYGLTGYNAIFGLAYTGIGLFLSRYAREA